MGTMLVFFNSRSPCLKRLAIAAGAALCLFVLAASSVHAQLQIKQGGLKGQACEAAGTAQVTNCGGSSKDPGGADGQFKKISRSVANIFSVIVGAISVIMIIIGGFRYVISGGDSNGVQGAKNTILYALVGLVIVLFAQIIARFVLARVG